MNPYLRLLNDNRGRRPIARGLRAEAGAQDEAQVYLYDVIVDTDLEAEWFGGISPLSFTSTLRGIDAPRVRLHLSLIHI